MKKMIAVAALLLSASAFAAEKAAPAKAPAMNKDEAIKAVFAQVDANFAKHDAKAFADVFADDATFIAPMGDGQMVKGKAEILKAHEMMMNGPAMKDVTSKHTVQNIRWIGKDSALVDCGVEFTGMKMEGMPAGAPAPTFHATVLMTMKKGHWLFEDVRPYAIMPMPAPAAESHPM